VSNTFKGTNIKYYDDTMYILGTKCI